MGTCCWNLGAGYERNGEPIRPGHGNDHRAERQPAQTEIHRSIVDECHGACAGECRR